MYYGLDCLDSSDLRSQNNGPPILSNGRGLQTKAAYLRDLSEALLKSSKKPLTSRASYSPNEFFSCIASTFEHERPSHRYQWSLLD